MLFYDLQDSMTSLRVHFASRRNNTRQDHPEELAVSPARVQTEGQSDQGVIIPVQYSTVIRHLAFLQGGQHLLDNAVFADMIASIDIINDVYDRVDSDAPYIFQDGRYKYVRTGGNYDKKPNPLTVPCDYVCNTFLKGPSFEPDERRISSTEGLFAPEHCLLYQVDAPLQRDTNIGLLKKEADATDLLQLISLDFPEPVTQKFYKLFNTASLELQRSALNTVIERIRIHVLEQKCMPLLAERLNHAIDSARHISNENLRSYYIANLLLFQRSLHTHLGNIKTVSSLSEQVYKYIDTLQNDSDRDTLLDIADNQSIVHLTDVFAYDTAIQLFEDAEKYWASKISARRRSDARRPAYPVWGKTIGSYLQVLRHQIHASQNQEEKELYYMEAQSKYDAYIHHLAENPGDLSRCHQTLCDIEADMGHFPAAVKHLYWASLYATAKEVDHEAPIPSLLEIGERFAWYATAEDTNSAFLLQHFMRMTALMYSWQVTEMADALFTPFRMLINDKWGSQIVNTHARTQVQWKTASILANNPGCSNDERRVANVLFDTAASTLLRNGTSPIFAAISAGIRAEQLSHILTGRIPGNKSTVYTALRKAYERFLALKSDTTPDPFEPYLQPLKGTDSVRMTSTLFNKVAQLIGY